ncbi:hypothetical protein HLB44_19040 [Aquincola sp. S2]|uniref:DUF4189 domain-containing protein n=1 Tax=Pseudaquabacterium terrae TaxID=2732868 RepID=A0ABX2EKE7_9BURK|nr:hypothetical protein [Aquabacterium terrae]NRF69095.1 hypothetical protein [Aquabacterium terrae]
MRLALALVLAALTQVACASASVDELIGDAACSSDAECRTVGVGALACGGPQAWRAWSIRRTTDEAALERAVQQQRQEREQAIAKRGEMSICRVVPDPGAHCAKPADAGAGRCVLRAAGAPGGGAAVR